MKIFVVIMAIAIVTGVPLEKDHWRIVGGSPALPGEFPYLASIRLDYTDGHMCGGIIISTRTILTAAHCFFGYSPSDVNVVVGTNLLDGSGDRYQLEEIHIHPNFHFLYLHYDVALAIVDRKIEMNPKVQSIPLSTDSTLGSVEATLSGWGTTIVGGDQPNELQTIKLLTITNEECNAIHGDFREIIDSQICTFTKSGEGACHGDSGSALTVNGKAIGIVSWGIPCGKGSPDVYSRVSSFDSWINDNMVD